MRTWILASIAAAVLATGVAAAHEHGGRADANGDGVLTRQEFDAGRAAMFARLDADNNGVLSRDEMRARRHGRHGRGGHGEGMHLAAADANDDGVISREEFLARPNQMFDRLDTDRNGVISQAERDAMRAQRSARRERMNPDANGDGAVSREEFDAAGAAIFNRLDANGDGRVTQDEAPRHHGHRS
jgi:Ca2+-binding EF-hand superfamily protein